MTDGSVIIDEGTEADCFTITSTSTIAEFGVKFNADFRVKGVIFVPRIDENNNVLTGDMYNTNSDV